MPISMSAAQSQLVGAMERNYFSTMRYWAQHYPGVEMVDEPGLLQFTTGIPVFIANTVVFSSCGDDQVEAQVQGILAKNRAKGLPMCWFIQPSSKPASLALALTAAGFTQMSDMPGMTVDLHALPDLTLKDGVEIKEVDSLELLKVWGKTTCEGFSLPEALLPFFSAPSEALGFGPELPLKNYLACLNGEPVGTSTLFVSDRLAGIYCVSTLERARGKGIGRAVTLAPLLAAREMGIGIGALQASKMGEPVYKKLGFEEQCRFEWWVAEA